MEITDPDVLYFLKLLSTPLKFPRMIRHKSVLHGRDNQVIPILLEIHAAPNPVILDCTYNTGKMWKGLEYKPIRMDINPEFGLDVVGDFTAMPFADNSLDVIVFDPPHLPTAGASVNSSKIWEKTYGITNEGAGRTGDNVSGMFLPFLIEAKRVLKENGIVLSKIADIIHNHRYQFQHVDYINSVKQIDMTPCDLLIKCDPSAGKLTSSKWHNVKHLRKAHCYWIVSRKGSCERK